MKIGPYEVIRELGRGSFAAVFLAQKQGETRQVAVKVLLKINNDTDRSRFKREAKVTAGLEHPGIVRCLDVGFDQRGFLYLALDHAQGGTLADRLDQGPMPIAEAVEVVAKLADAIDYAHGKGILHRDLKPANILFDARGEPRISDFGLASYRGHMRLTASEDVLGTPYYMAPEQFEGRSILPQVDVYGLGAILYHALTGDVVYRAANMSEMKEFVRKRKTRPPSRKRPDVPPALDEVCVTAMAHDPDDRYMKAADLAAALRASLTPHPIVKAKPPRVPWHLVGGGAAVLALAVLIFAAAGSSGPPADGPPPDIQPAPPPPVAVTPQDPLPPARPTVRPEAVKRPALERAREAVARWGFVEAERLLKVARDGGAEPQQVTEVVNELAEAREAERATCKRLDEGYNRWLLASEGLAEAEALLQEHPDATELRLVAAHLHGILGHYTKSLEHLERVVELDPENSDRQLENRRFMRQMTELAARDPWTEDPPFADWRPMNGGQWRKEGPGQLRGRLQGMAQFGFAGLVYKPAGVLKAPYEVSVELELDTSQPAAFGGVIIGLQDADNCLLVYVLHDTRIKEKLGLSEERWREELAKLRGFEGDRALRYARWRNSTWEQIGDDHKAEFADSGWTRLSVSVGDGKLAATVNGVAIPPVGLPDDLDGRVGIVKWYDNVVGYRNFGWKAR